MSFFQKFIRFLFCTQLFFNVVFSTSFSKAFNIGDAFNITIYLIMLVSFLFQIHYIMRMKIAFIILIFTFLSSYYNGFVGLRVGIIINFLSFTAVELAIVSTTFQNMKLFFKLFFFLYAFILSLSIFLITIGVNTQPFTGMYMAVKVGGIPVQIWGLFSDKNTFGFTMMLIFLMSFLLPNFKYRNIVLITAFVFVILSGNRSGLLTLCVSMVFLFIVKPEYTIGKKLSVALLASIILVLIVYIYSNSPLNTRGVESKDREELYAIAFSFINHHFWFGIGRALIVGGEYIHTHNLYLQVLAEEGFLCLVVYIILFLKVLIKASYSAKILSLSIFIFTAFNPALVPGNLFTVALLIILGRYIDEVRAWHALEPPVKNRTLLQVLNMKTIAPESAV